MIQKSSVVDHQDLPELGSHESLQFPGLFEPGAIKTSVIYILLPSRIGIGIFGLPHCLGPLRLCSIFIPTLLLQLPIPSTSLSTVLSSDDEIRIEGVVNYRIEGL
ncbi:hypothetical protein Tco_0085557 [Tanacetum coccineum]